MLTRVRHQHLPMRQQWFQQKEQLEAMLQDAPRRKAVRETLTADRDGLAERISRVDVPTLVIMGAADSHFKDAAAEGTKIAEQTGGELVVVPNAGHYPHAEYPDAVATAITSFLTPNGQ